MNWSWDDDIFNQYLNEHAPDISGGIGHLLSRNIITGGSVEWGRKEPARADIDLLGALPAMPSRKAAEIFIRAAHGWPTNPFELNREPATRALADSNIWLHWPKREHGWHWVMSFPRALALPQQFTMASILYDELPGDMHGRICLEENGSPSNLGAPMTIQIDRRGQEATVTTTRSSGKTVQQSRSNLQETIRFALDDANIDYVN